MVGVTRRSNSSSKRATMVRVIRCSSPSERARVMLSTVSPAAKAARLCGSTRSQSMSLNSHRPALTTWRKGPSAEGSKTPASSLDTWWPAASSKRPACSTAAVGSSATGGPRSDTVHSATRS